MVRHKNKLGQGRLVMVHPDLTTDPLNKQGFVGRVKSIDNPEKVTISFIDGTSGAYDPTGLITLFPRQVIAQGILSNINEQSAEDQQCLLSIRRLVNQNKHAKALQVAMSNDTSKFYCTTTLDSWMQMQLSGKQTKGHKKKVVGYVRTAVANNNQCIAQDENIRNHCRKEQLELIKVFYDLGQSGHEPNGKGWLDLKSFVAKENGQISRIVVDSLDRLGRDVFGVITEVNNLKDQFQVEVMSIQPMEQGISKLLKDESQNRSDKIKMGIHHAKLRKKGNSM